ncbi:hypothetical protein [Actinomyces procaprae]|uniref:hypothetical protein n=1 Tax=Actinomyces procaprae TaxID=2560010 RepID=UPI00109DF35A|nr:hypothetical protein [Actinomyces procaprae]
MPEQEAIEKLLGKERFYADYERVTVSQISAMSREDFERLHDTLRVAELYRATAPFSSGTAA